MSGFNLADVWEAVARVQPDAPAIVQGHRRYSWADFDRRANGVAARLPPPGTPLPAAVAGPDRDLHRLTHATIRRVLRQFTSSAK